MIQELVNRITQRAKYISVCDSSLLACVFQIRDVCKDPRRHDGLSEKLKNLLIMIENELLHQGDIFEPHKKAFWETLGTNAPTGMSMTVGKLEDYAELIQGNFKDDESISRRLKTIEADTDAGRAAVARLFNKHDAQKSAVKLLICAISTVSHNLLAVGIEEIILSETVGTKIKRFGKFDETEPKAGKAALEISWSSLPRDLLTRGYEVFRFAGSKVLASVIALYNFIVYCFKASYERVSQAVTFVKNSVILTAQPNVQSNRQGSSSAEWSSALHERSVSGSSGNDTADGKTGTLTVPNKLDNNGYDL